MKISELLPLMNIHGRHIVDKENDLLFTDWTCSGFTIGVKGTYLKVKVKALYDQVPDFFIKGELPKDWPCIAASIDSSEELTARQKIDEEEKWIEIYRTDKIEEHAVRLIKLSENARGKLAYAELETDGEFYKVSDDKKVKIEIIGDSITCGYGNEDLGGGVGKFDTNQENGWTSYAAQASRKLGYEFSMVCESGICAVQPQFSPFKMHAMEDIYAYEDALLEEKLGKEKTEHKFDNDIVIASLCTNDTNPIKFANDFEKVEPGEKWFEEHYYEFVKQLRRCNGPETNIICCLGPMDYYLYYRMYNAIERYKKESGDKKIFCFEFMPMNVFFEGVGGAGHPSQKTHDRMAVELMNYIKKFCGAEYENR